MNREPVAFPWRRFVVWGHRLHRDTFSYVHEALLRSARWLGIDAVWLADEPITGDGLENSLFFVHGKVDRHLPIREDCTYVLHNCDLSRPEYRPIVERENYLILQVFTQDVFQWDVHAVEAAPGAYLLAENRTLFMPWASDLVPDEVERQRQRLNRLLRRRRDAAWVGTIGAGEFGNVEQLSPFVQEAARLDLRWRHWTQISRKKHVRVIERALLAPAIVGAWQLEKGYVPCRIFKNLSYGHIGATNSATVSGLFPQGLCLQSEDTGALCRTAFEWNATTPLAEREAVIGEAMEEVRLRHTYASRIRTIARVIEEL